MSAEALIEEAAKVLRPERVGDRTFGDVGAAILSASGRVFSGVSVDTPGWGLCAERSALAAMVTAGERRFLMAIAVWRDDASRLHVLPPCGGCREFMRQLDPGNLEAEILLGMRDRQALGALLPYHAWPGPLDGQS